MVPLEVLHYTWYICDETCAHPYRAATAITTIWSGLAYMKGDAVKYLKSTDDIKAIKDEENKTAP
jgi:hypothetical protein